MSHWVSVRRLNLAMQKIKEHIDKNQFSEAGLEIDTTTGQLVAHQSGNLSLRIDEYGHLNSEVKK